MEDKPRRGFAEHTLAARLSVSKADRRSHKGVLDLGVRTLRAAQLATTALGLTHSSASRRPKPPSWSTSFMTPRRDSRQLGASRPRATCSYPGWCTRETPLTCSRSHYLEGRVTFTQLTVILRPRNKNAYPSSWYKPCGKISVLKVDTPDLGMKVNNSLIKIPQLSSKY